MQSVSNIARVQKTKEKLIKARNAGNLIDPQHNSAWFYFNGYDSTLAKPNIFVR